MSAAFDPWSVLAEIRNSAPTPPNPANPPNPAAPAPSGLGALGGLGGGYPSELKNAVCADTDGNGPAAGLAIDHDAAEQAAMVVLYAEEGGSTAYDPSRPDEIRDGLYRGFHAHRPTWDALPYGPDRGAAFADARVDPGACPTCAGRRWWRHAADAAGALTCATCHPADHLPAEAVQEVVT